MHCIDASCTDLLCTSSKQQLVMVSIAQLHTILKKSNKYEKIAIAIGSIQQLCGPTFTQFWPPPTLETKMDIFHTVFFSTDPFPPFFEQQVIEYPHYHPILVLLTKFPFQRPKEKSQNICGVRLKCWKPSIFQLSYGVLTSGFISS